MEFSVDQNGSISIVASHWPGLSLCGLRPVAELDGVEAALDLLCGDEPAGMEGARAVCYELAGRLRLQLALEPGADTITPPGDV